MEQIHIDFAAAGLACRITLSQVYDRFIADAYVGGKFVQGFESADLMDAGERAIDAAVKVADGCSRVPKKLLANVAAAQEARTPAR